MENNKKFQYKEQFLFRTRVHTLTNNEIRTEQNDFFISSDILTKIEDLGHRLQYKSDLRLFEIFSSIVFLVIGIKGLVKSVSDSIVFAISIIMIFSALYWIVIVLFNLKYIGGFYFSNSTEKTNGAFEIKSKYPASEELALFLHEIRLRQRHIAIENLIKYLDKDESDEEHLMKAIYIKHTFPMSESEFDSLINRIKAKVNK
jgi:hypothetical protein